MPRNTDQACCPPEGFRSTGSFDEDLSILCKALSNPARVRIVQILARQGECISGDLAEALNLAPSTVSEHLRILKEAGFIQGTIDGLKRCYCINSAALSYLAQLLSKF